jgi:hypothetical protein
LANADEVKRQLDQFATDVASLTEHDRALIQHIMDVSPQDDPLRVADLIRRYYADMDRAERTPRGILYLHIGILSGLVASRS